MAVRFIGVASAQEVGSAITVVVPSRLSLQVGDLLFLFLTVQGYTSTVLTVPAGWILESSPFVAGDQILFTALHYVTAAAEPGTYIFSYAASKPMVAVMGAYRGARQDLEFDPVNYPFGYYAPGGSTGAASLTTGFSSVATPASGAAALVRFSKAVVFLGATHGSAMPQLSDVVPFIAIRVKVESVNVSAMLCDVVEPDVRPVLPVYASAASVTLSGAIGLVRVFEPTLAANDSLDTYKAKIMRRLVPPPYDARYSEVLGQMLTVMGGGDNDIGGLFGAADFLPDEVT